MGDNCQTSARDSFQIVLPVTAKGLNAKPAGKGMIFILINKINVFRRNEIIRGDESKVWSPGVMGCGLPGLRYLTLPSLSTTFANGTVTNAIYCTDLATG